MKASEKFLISLDFMSTSHGRLGCIACHKGESFPDMEIAHRGMKKDPSEGRANVCTKCHKQLKDKFSRSLHYTLTGIRDTLHNRAGSEYQYEAGPVERVFESNCYSCHSSCGDCHVSRPTPAQGGLYAKHLFMKRAPMQDSCYACHGERSAGEYLGTLGYRADVHWREKKMVCGDCHKLSDFHGAEKVYRHKYEVDALPRCTDCHKNAISENSKTEAHRAPCAKDLSCPVCHSLPNKNCFGCHITYDESNMRITRSEKSMIFKIGLNPKRDERHPEKYVVLRHVPAARDVLESLGVGVYMGYDSGQAWTLSSSHNIQRVTPYSEECNSCHGNEKIFLTENDLKLEDSVANREVIVSGIPKKIEKDAVREEEGNEN